MKKLALVLVLLIPSCVYGAPQDDVPTQEEETPVTLPAMVLSTHDLTDGPLCSPPGYRYIFDHKGWTNMGVKYSLDEDTQVLTLGSIAYTLKFTAEDTILFTPTGEAASLPPIPMKFCPSGHL